MDQSPFRLASYAWPSCGALDTDIVGNGPRTIAVGLLPHSHEPLGSAILGCQETFEASLQARALVIRNVDPPPSAACFPLPTDFVTFLRSFHLPPLADQVEFSHGAGVHRASQARAHSLRRLLVENDVSCCLLIHNDAFARFPYLYANQEDSVVERALVAAAAGNFELGELPFAWWTDVLSPLTYRYFPLRRLISDAETECAGVFIERALGIRMLTLELPMFDWSSISEDRRQELRRLYKDICRLGVHGDSRAAFIEGACWLSEADVPMVPAAASARVACAVVGCL